MKKISIIIVLNLFLYSCCKFSDEEMGKSLNWYYNLYEMDSTEVNKIVKYGNCIYPKLENNLRIGLSDTAAISYKKYLEQTFDEVRNISQTKNDFVNYYLTNQKANYQIRSIEPMFKIDKEKTKKIVDDFIKKAANNPSFARKDVVKYAEGRLNFYSKLK